MSKLKLKLLQRIEDMQKRKSDPWLRKEMVNKNLSNNQDLESQEQNE